VELTAAQRERVAQAAPAREAPAGKLPEGLRGFSGRLHGTVCELREHGVVLEVDDVLDVWKDNRAAQPRAAVGRRLLVNVQWVRGDGGRWHPAETHQRFLKTLEVGEELAIEVRNDEADRLHILELSEAQRARR
jgi:hypothetical protein